MLPPSEWYAQQDLSQHYMRWVRGPFEQGVSRGNVRVMRNYPVEHGTIETCYPIITENRARKGRNYGMAYKNLWDIQDKLRCFLIPDMAAAICVIVRPTVCYVSAWGHIAGDSPVVSLCRHIYEWCEQNHFDVLDVGIGGDKGLNDFKSRLGFSRGCDVK